MMLSGANHAEACFMDPIIAALIYLVGACVNATPKIMRELRAWRRPKDSD